ncbi:hypothetical protein SLEP1_g1336 [Rubroshorea leprosula]|uniref:Uncharacterized protein n=1 Tax=Rubroshorea leprosula TaxID=152421 RepID=A0AAV5HJ93_9ROSI|nr:hypothetical protein SLEP1_g1336 [Rubroshorea leprosula]
MLKHSRNVVVLEGQLQKSINCGASASGRQVVLRFGIHRRTAMQMSVGMVVGCCCIRCRYIPYLDQATLDALPASSA